MRLSALSPFLPILVLALSVGGPIACGSVTFAQTGGSGGSGGGSGGADTTTTTTSSSVATTTSTGTGGTVDHGAPSDVYPAPHAPPPQAVSYGGPILAAPRIVPVFFSNEDPTLRAQLEDFSSKIGATAFWAANTAEYGVGPATAVPPIELAETATGTIDDTDIQLWLAGKFESEDPAFPTMPYGDLIVTLHYPIDVTITFGDGGGGVIKSCESFGGYHNSITLDAAHGNARVAYAVMPHCDPFGPLTGINAATVTETHELIEAATDPYPLEETAYGGIDDDHIYWMSFLGGGEIGDMCTRLPGVFFKFDELPYTVQRSWSNKSANAGHDPCVPALPGVPYFNAAPVQNDTVTATVFGTQIDVKGVSIPVGATRAIEIDLFSDADTGGPFTVDVQDIGYVFGDETADLYLDLDRSSGVNGEKIYLNVTVNAAGQNNMEMLLITSTLGETQNYWLAIIGN